MDDILVLAPTRWKGRHAVQGDNQVCTKAISGKESPRLAGLFDQ